MNVQGRRPCHVGGAKTGAGGRVGASAHLGREDGHARSDQVDIGAIVAEGRERVIGTPAQPLEDEGRPVPAGLAVGIGEGGDGDHHVVSGRDAELGVHALVAGRNDDGGASGHQALDRRAESNERGVSGILGTDGAGGAEAHVHYFDKLIPGAVGGIRHPVQSSDNVGEGTAAGAIEHLHGPEAGARSNPHHIGPVVEGSDNPGYVGSMTSVVVAVEGGGRLGGDQGDSADNHQVRVAEIDARVDDRDIHASAVVGRVRSSRLGVNAVDTRGYGLTGSLNDQVCPHGLDARVPFQGFQSSF